MHVTWNVKHGQKDERLEALLEREQERILRHLGDVPDDLVSLHCELDRSLHHREAEASLSVRTPERTYHARASGPNLPAALRRVADALVAELDHRRGRARRDSRRGDSMVGLAAVPAEVAGPSADERAHLIRRGVAELYRFVRIERDRHRETLERAEVGAIEIPDVVDDAIVRALSTERERPEDVPFDRWLVSCAYDSLLEREDEVLRAGSPGSSLEEEVVEDPDADDLDLAETIVRRDEPVFRSDLMAGEERPAEELAARRQLAEALSAVLDELPAEDRAALEAYAALDGAAAAGEATLLAAESARRQVLDALRLRGVL